MRKRGLPGADSRGGHGLQATRRSSARSGPTSAMAASSSASRPRPRWPTVSTTGARPSSTLRRGRVDADALGSGAVADVEGQDERQAQLQQLRGEVQVALQVRGVDDVDDGVGLTAQQVVTGDDLLGREGREAVGARQVDEATHDVPVAEGALRAGHGLAGPVADVLPRAGERVEDARLAGVGIAGQGQRQRPLTLPPQAPRQRRLPASPRAASASTVMVAASRRRSERW